ncbi:MAG: protein-S-isoprenylcysteine O-methyltransferase [Burkholderiaceae bacterium]
MNLQAPNLLFMVGIAVYLGIRNYFQHRVRGRKTSINESSAGDKLLIVLVVVGQIVLPAQYVFSRWLNAGNYLLPMVVNVLGALCLFVGLWLFWRSHADLGPSWSVTLEMRESHVLVTRGVYSRIRHPMYASFFLMSMAQGFLLANWIAGWAALVAVILLYTVRVPQEEAMLLRSFGPQYEAYMRRTGGVVPRIGRAHGT